MHCHRLTPAAGSLKGRAHTHNAVIAFRFRDSVSAESRTFYIRTSGLSSLHEKILEKATRQNIVGNL